MATTTIYPSTAYITTGWSPSTGTHVSVMGDASDATYSSIVDTTDSTIYLKFGTATSVPRNAIIESVSFAFRASAEAVFSGTPVTWTWYIAENSGDVLPRTSGSGGSFTTDGVVRAFSTTTLTTDMSGATLRPGSIDDFYLGVRGVAGSLITLKVMEMTMTVSWRGRAGGVI